MRLPARAHPYVAALLAYESALADVADEWGTPLNLVFPDVLRGNIDEFRTLLARYDISYRINFAHKVNQSAALVLAAREHGIGIDVASAGELRSARAAGFTGDRIEATGPKGRALLGELIAAGACVNVDNAWELTQLAAMAASVGRRVPVLVRLCEPAAAAVGPRRLSRFGVTSSQFRLMLATLLANRESVDFAGFSFHLDTGDTGPRLRMVDECLRLTEECWAAGLSPRILDVGGGFRQVFTAELARFDAYSHALREGLAGRGDALTWNGTGLGYRHEAGSVRGVPVYHRFGNTVGPAESLAALLDGPLPGQGGRAVARVLRDNLLELWLEPGKGLADQAGVTIAQVEFVKEAADGSTLVNLDISRDKIAPADQEIMVDPALIYRTARAPAPGRVYFAGNLCLERDMIYQHATYLDRLPEPGDLVVFVNTAAYQMDLSASAALMYPSPARLAVSGPPGALIVRADLGAGTALAAPGVPELPGRAHAL